MSHYDQQINRSVLFARRNHHQFAQILLIRLRFAKNPAIFVISNTFVVSFHDIQPMCQLSFHGFHGFHGLSGFDDGREGIFVGCDDVFAANDCVCGFVGDLQPENFFVGRVGDERENGGLQHGDACVHVVDAAEGLENVATAVDWVQERRVSVNVERLDELLDAGNALRSGQIPEFY